MADGWRLTTDGWQLIAGSWRAPCGICHGIRYQMGISWRIMPRYALAPDPSSATRAGLSCWSIAWPWVATFLLWIRLTALAAAASSGPIQDEARSRSRDFSDGTGALPLKRLIA